MVIDGAFLLIVLRPTVTRWYSAEKEPQVTRQIEASLSASTQPKPAVARPLRRTG